MKRVMRLPPLLAASLLLAALSGRGRAQSPSEACRNAIASAEITHRIPDAFLSAIGKVESGRVIDGKVVPWPWTINAEGVGTFFATKNDAIAAVQALQARGLRSIDVGCLQVNLQQHPEAFRSLEQAFDPATNAQFAADLLVSLFRQAGSWPLAAAAYHSQTPTIGATYQRQVLAAWAQPDRPEPAASQSQGHTTEAARPASLPAPTQRLAGASGPAAFGRQAGFLAGEQPHTGAPADTGRGLAAYRAMPVRLAFRPLVRPG